jgi:hypothetical protein
MLPVANQRRLGNPLLYGRRFLPGKKAAPRLFGLGFDSWISQYVDDVTTRDELARQPDFGRHGASAFPHAEQKMALSHLAKD